MEAVARIDNNPTDDIGKNLGVLTALLDMPSMLVKEIALAADGTHQHFSTIRVLRRKLVRALGIQSDSEEWKTQ